jgi:PAS domain S-box-containing protein/putative nucleotidyltransferase with HDIG domain
LFQFNNIQVKRIDRMKATKKTNRQAMKKSAKSHRHITKLKESKTERKHFKSELQRSEDQFRTIFENSLVGIYRTTPDGRILLGNPRLVEMLGFSSFEELAARNLDAEGFEPDYSRTTFKDLMERDGEVRGLEAKWTRRNGSVLIVRESARAVRGKKGGVIYYDGVVEDITELKQVEHNLKKRIKEIKCLTAISRLAEKPGITIKEFLRGAVDLLPVAWQYPEITCARIVLDSEDFKTVNFKETRWTQTADIKVDSKKFGAVTVCYLEEKPAADEGPFLKEERILIVTIADFLGHVIQHRLTEMEIRESEAKFKTIFSGTTDGILLADMESKKFYLGNEAICRMLGYELEELTRLGVTEIHPKEALSYVLEQFELQSQGKITLARDLPVKRKDGSVFYADINSKLVNLGGKQYMAGMFHDTTERKRAEKQLSQSVEKLRTTLEKTVNALSSAAGKRDQYTAGHQRRVTQLACAIAVELGLTPDQIDGIRIAGLLHDIGKIAVPAEILAKPTVLTDAEFGIVRAHAETGYDIIKDIDFPWPVAQIVIQHHERLNGSGYPSKLQANDILPEAKILGVADVVEAMCSHRPYRPARGIETALDEITQNKGRLYDGSVVDACLRLFREKNFKFE